DGRLDEAVFNVLDAGEFLDGPGNERRPATAQSAIIDKASKRHGDSQYGTNRRSPGSSPGPYRWPILLSSTGRLASQGTSCCIPWRAGSRRPRSPALFQLL